LPTLIVLRDIAYVLTDSGWNWVMENEQQFSLKSPQEE
jgi:hypothetical protein